MRQMGLDVGTRTIGVAIGDPSGMFAFPLEVIKREGWKQEAARLEQFVRQYDVQEIVIGLPIRTDGREASEANLVRKFGHRLAGRLGLPVLFWDERFSTASATHSLIEADVRRERRKEVVDAVAAAIILQNYLDYKSKERERNDR